jgi:hypothetical protein
MLSVGPLYLSSTCQLHGLLSVAGQSMDLSRPPEPPLEGPPPGPRLERRHHAMQIYGGPR